MLKKALSICFALLLFSLSACSTQNRHSPSATTMPESTSDAQDLITGLNTEETTHSKSTENESAAQLCCSDL